MPRNITLRIVGDTVQRSKSRAGVQGEGNITKLICCFDSTWDGLAKSLTFWNADIANPVTQLLTESKRTGDREYTVLFPAEPLELAGKCVVTIDGAQDGVRAKTLAVSFDVAPAPSTDSAKDPAAPTPTQAEQLQKEMEAVQNDIAAVTNMTVEAVGLKAGASPTVKKEMADGAIRMTFGIPAGEKGDPGIGIRSIERTSGSGEPGTRDEYTITMTDGTTSVFYVYNGADGTGGGEGGRTPEKGVDYFTPEEVDEIVNRASGQALEGVTAYVEGTGEISVADAQDAQVLSLTVKGNAEKSGGEIRFCQGDLTIRGETGNVTVPLPTLRGVKLASGSGYYSRDRIETDGSGKATVTRYVRKLVLDGSESFIEVGSGTSKYYALKLGDLGIAKTGGGWCNLFDWTSINSSNTAQGFCILESKGAKETRLAIRPDLNTCGNVSSFTSNLCGMWEDGNPVVVYYQATEPTVENMEVPEVRTFSGDNVITAPQLGEVELEYVVENGVTGYVERKMDRVDSGMKELSVEVDKASEKLHQATQKRVYTKIGEMTLADDSVSRLDPLSVFSGFGSAWGKDALLVKLELPNVQGHQIMFSMFDGDDTDVEKCACRINSISGGTSYFVARWESVFGYMHLRVQVADLSSAASLFYGQSFRRAVSLPADEAAGAVILLTKAGNEAVPARNFPAGTKMEVYAPMPVEEQGAEHG